MKILTEPRKYSNNDPGHPLFDLGTPQKLITETGQKVWEGSADAFGKTVISNNLFTNPLRFPGQYKDDESTLRYNYFRYYDLSLGRYITPDPIGLKGGVNLYSYVNSNPIVFNDPTGLLTTITNLSLISHYIVGDGQSVYLTPEDGKLYSQTDPVRNSINDFIGEVHIEIRQKARQKCKGECEKTKVFMLPVGPRVDHDVNVTMTGSFIIGGHKLWRKADCVVDVDCSTRKYKVQCGLTFRMHMEEFDHPFDINWEPGNPYRIYHAWGEPYISEGYYFD